MFDVCDLMDIEELERAFRCAVIKLYEAFFFDARDLGDLCFVCEECRASFRDALVA